jgi:hypothetical protein
MEKVGKPFSVGAANWNRLRQFVYEQFGNGNPPPTDNLLEFLSGECKSILHQITCESGFGTTQNCG